MLANLAKIRCGLSVLILHANSIHFQNNPQMTRASTDKKTWVHVRTFYQVGFPIPTGSYIRVRNLGAARGEVQFRWAADSTETLQDFGCVEYKVYAYAEVWIRSLDGGMVSVDCNWGKCSFGLVEEGREHTSDRTRYFTDEDIDPKLAELLHSLVVTYKEILTFTGYQLRKD